MELFKVDHAATECGPASHNPVLSHTLFRAIRIRGYNERVFNNRSIQYRIITELLDCNPSTQRLITEAPHTTIS